MNGIDTFVMYKRQKGTIRVGAPKLKMPGNYISVPTHPAPAGIKDWAQMIIKGELTQGEQCHPCKIEKFRTVGGNVSKVTNTVYG